MRAEGRFPGRLASFAEVRGLAERFAAMAGADPDTTGRLVLVLEELFTNTVAHGYSPGAEGPIWVTLAAESGLIEITYEDAARAFDPLTEAPVRPELAPGVDASAVGGLGLILVRALSASARYARIGD